MDCRRVIASCRQIPQFYSGICRETAISPRSASVRTGSGPAQLDVPVPAHPLLTWQPEPALAPTLCENFGSMSPIAGGRPSPRPVMAIKSVRRGERA